MAIEEKTEDSTSGVTRQKDQKRLLANLIFCAMIWGLALAVGVDIFGDRWAGIDLCFRGAFYWCALNVASSAFWIDVAWVSSGHRQFSLFQCILWVALYHVGGVVGAVIITLKQATIIDVSIFGAVLLTFGIVFGVVAYCGIGLFLASVRGKGRD